MRHVQTSASLKFLKDIRTGDMTPSCRHFKKLETFSFISIELHIVTKRWPEERNFKRKYLTYFPRRYDFHPRVNLLFPLSKMVKEWRTEYLTTNENYESRKPKVYCYINNILYPKLKTSNNQHYESWNSKLQFFINNIFCPKWKSSNNQNHESSNPKVQCCIYNILYPKLKASSNHNQESWNLRVQFSINKMFLS